MKRACVALMHTLSSYLCHIACILGVFIRGIQNFEGPIDSMEYCISPIVMTVSK